MHLDPSGVSDLQEAFLIPKDGKIFKSHVGGKDFRNRNFLYRMNLVDDSLHPKGDFVAVTLPADSCLLYGSPGRAQTRVRLPCREYDTNLPDFREFDAGQPVLIQDKGKVVICLFGRIAVPIRLEPGCFLRKTGPSGKEVLISSVHMFDRRFQCKLVRLVQERILFFQFRKVFLVICSRKGFLFLLVQADPFFQIAVADKPGIPDLLI